MFTNLNNSKNYFYSKLNQKSKTYRSGLPPSIWRYGSLRRKKAERDSFHFISLLLCYFFFAALPLLRLYRIIWVSPINNILKVFLCFANKKADLNSGNNKKFVDSCRKKVVEFFPLTQIMHSCSNSIRKVPLYLVTTIEMKFSRVIPLKLEFVIRERSLDLSRLRTLARRLY